jgi:REP element-mobilizing transposase RayT
VHLIDLRAEARCPAHHVPSGPRRPPRCAHHVTQRGNGRAQTLLGEDDYRLYLDVLARHCAAAGVDVWTWVLMPNHGITVHFIVRLR